MAYLILDYSPGVFNLTNLKPLLGDNILYLSPSFGKNFGAGTNSKFLGTQKGNPTQPSKGRAPQKIPQP